MIFKRFSLFILILSFIIHLEGSPVNIPEIKQSSPFEVNDLIHNLNARSISSQTYAVHNSVEETIKEVEDILKSNPSLPRLTRGEILDLLENITKTDSVKVNAHQDLRDPKAIMVVMPFTPSNDANNMEELYTKPPVTHLIDAEPFKKTLPITTQKPIFRRKRPSKATTTTTEAITTTLTTTEKLISNSHAQSQKKGNVRRRRPVTTKTVTPTTTTVRTSTYTSRTRSPVRRRPVSTTVKYENHQYPEEILEFTQEQHTPNSGMRIVNPPKFIYNDNSNDDLSDLYLQEDNVQEIYHKPDSSMPSGFTSNKKPTEYKRSTTPPSLIDEFNIPNNLKPVFTGMNLNAALDDPPKRKTVQKPQSINDVEKINELLASMGMYFPTTLPPTSTSSRVPDLKNVADTLTPEMKDLLMSFGLIPNPNGNAVKSTKSEDNYYYPPSKPEIDHDAYVSFKPLPEDNSKRSEMDELLATYGLRTTRNQKSMKNKVDNDGNRLNFDMVPDSLKHVLDDIGLRDIKEESNSSSAPTEENTQVEKHVFKPMESEYATEEEMEKLEKLLTLVRSLEKLNRTVTEDDLKKVDIENIKDLVRDLKTEKPIVPLDEQKNSPNPLHFDNGLSKNEVKRQESTTTAKTISSSTTEEPKSPSIKDLEDSFGGQSETVGETAAVETTTEAKKTGFYYLVDWNTFLDIDNQKGKRVNLRFQPTIGNPKNFLSVSVP